MHMYACARLCTYVCACTCINVCTCGGQRSTLGVFLNCSGSYIQELSPSINLQVIKWVGWLPVSTQDYPVSTSPVGLQAHTAKLSSDSHRYSAHDLLGHLSH